MSKVLHGFWLAESYVLAFWLEDPDGTDCGALTPSSFHPNGLFYDDLFSLLPADLNLYEGTRSVLFPTLGGRPANSRTAINDQWVPASWHIHTAETIADYAFDDFLPNLAGIEFKGEVVGASSLHYWCHLFDYARCLFDYKLFVPGMVRLENKYYPSWQAAIPESQRAYLRRMILAMPPICAVMDNADHGGENEDVAGHLAMTFLDACMDYLVRRHIMLRYPREFIKTRFAEASMRRWTEGLRRGRIVSLGCDDPELRRMSAQIASWNSGVRSTGADPSYRLGFRVAPVGDSNPSWRLTLFLRSTRMPDQSISAATVFAGPTDASEAEWFPNAVEGFLEQLAAATGDFSRLHELFASHPQYGCALSPEEVCAFVHDAAPRLRRHGYFVDVPSWLNGTDSRFGFRLIFRTDPDASTNPASLGLGRRGHCEWSIVAGGAALTEAELEALTTATVPLLYFRDGWLRVDPAVIRDASERLAKCHTGKGTTLDEVISLIAEGERPGELPVVDVRIHHASAAPAEIKTVPVLPTPCEFRGHLRPYQVAGFSWLVWMRGQRLGACLADDMGLGKTIQTIAYLVHMRNCSRQSGPHLIISPMSILGNWKKELDRFAPALRVRVHYGLDRLEGDGFVRDAEGYDVVLTTYARIVRDRVSFVRVTWGSVILDEAQNIKNPRTKQARATRMLRAQQRICLTGTPVENRLAELWSILEFLNPGYLGSAASFKGRFTVPIERDGDLRKTAILRELIHPFVLRRLKNDRSVVVDLPEKLEMKVYCNLTPEQATLYREVVAQMLHRIRITEGLHRRGLIISALSKLKQIANHPVQYLKDNSAFTSDRSGKLLLLEEMLAVALQAGDKAIIFTQYSSFGALLRDKFEHTLGREVLFLHGGTPRHNRDEMIERFQRSSGPPLFVLSLKAGGFGLNLTQAQHVFHVDRWWNPAVENQATDRVHRIGQQRAVQIHKFITLGTVEERIDDMLHSKSKLAGDILVSGQGFATELNDQELHNLVAFSGETMRA